jgi:hypothetical protein
LAIPFFLFVYCYRSSVFILKQKLSHTVYITPAPSTHPIGTIMLITKTIQTSTLLVIALASSSVFADPICTKEDQSKWIPFEQAKQQILDLGYNIKNFKVTKTNCYELYGHNKEGNRVEIYYNPVDMSIIKEE